MPGGTLSPAILAITSTGDRRSPGLTNVAASPQFSLIDQPRQRKKMCTLCFELFANCLLNGRVADYGLLGGADRSVVETLSRQNILDRFRHICGSLNECRNVTRSHAAGFVDERRHQPRPAVARITAVCRCFMRVSVPSIVAVVMQPIASAGSPSLIPTSRITRTVSLIQRAADGCGETRSRFAI